MTTRRSENGWQRDCNNKIILKYGRLPTMPRVDHDAERLLEYLIQRSGIVREPTTGRVDFVHRPFQEFLTAEEAADQGDAGLLVQNAH